MLDSNAKTSLGMSRAASRNHCGPYKSETLNSCRNVAVWGSQPSGSESAAISRRWFGSSDALVRCKSDSSRPNDLAHAESTTCWFDVDRPGQLRASLNNGASCGLVQRLLMLCGTANLAPQHNCHRPCCNSVAWRQRLLLSLRRRVRS